MSKVYKSRQKLNFEQAGQYYKFAFNIGLEHGKFSERSRIEGIIQREVPLAMQEDLLRKIKEQK